MEFGMAMIFPECDIDSCATESNEEIQKQTFPADVIEIGYHPDGYRIDKTASAMDRYTKWDVSPDGKWTDPTPVCFHSLPENGWLRTDHFDWNNNNRTA